MLYYNNKIINFEKYNLKNFTKETYAGSSDSYYETFFEIIRMTDEIIEELFDKNSYKFTFIYDAFGSGFELNKETEFKKFKVFTVCQNVENRMCNEHNLWQFLEIKIEDTCGVLSINMDFGWKKKYVYDSNGWGNNTRQSGRTTKNANQCIELAYNQWKSKLNCPVNIIDHYTFEMFSRDPFMRGRRIAGMNQFNKHLFDKIKKRIDFEFTDEMLKFVRMSSNCDILFDFPHVEKIDYNEIS